MIILATIHAFIALYYQQSKSTSIITLLSPNYMLNGLNVIAQYYQEKHIVLANYTVRCYKLI